MATDALNFNLPAALTHPAAIIDQWSIRPKIRFDLSAARKQDWVLVDIAYDAQLNDCGWVDLAARLRGVATAELVIQEFRDLSKTVVYAAPEWPVSSLTSAFMAMREDYDVAETEELSLLATRTYGW
jgi:hypothetical protein